MRVTTIFGEKRECLSRLTELNRQLRDLQHLDADAVDFMAKLSFGK